MQNNSFSRSDVDAFICKILLVFYLFRISFYALQKLGIPTMNSIKNFCGGQYKMTKVLKSSTINVQIMCSMNKYNYCFLM